MHETIRRTAEENTPDLWSAGRSTLGLELRQRNYPRTRAPERGEPGGENVLRTEVPPELLSWGRPCPVTPARNPVGFSDVILGIDHRPTQLFITKFLSQLKAARTAILQSRT